MHCKEYPAFIKILFYHSLPWGNRAKLIGTDRSWMYWKTSMLVWYKDTISPFCVLYILRLRCRNIQDPKSLRRWIQPVFYLFCEMLMTATLWPFGKCANLECPQLPPWHLEGFRCLNTLSKAPVWMKEIFGQKRCKCGQIVWIVIMNQNCATLWATAYS